MASQESYDRIQSVYVAYYGRPADPAGLDYWAQRLEESGGNLEAIIDAFGNSDEFTQRWAGETYQSLVDNLYRQSFGRAAEAGGLAAYVDLLESGQASLADIALRIIDGATGEDREVLDNRLAVAAEVTGRIRELEVLADVDTFYDIAADLDDATDVDDYLAAVTAADGTVVVARTDASLDRLMVDLGYVFPVTPGGGTPGPTGPADPPAPPVTPVPPGPTGPTDPPVPPVPDNLRLVGTDGPDRLVGGAGNDTLAGLAGFDTLEGGPGDDRLDGGADFDWAYYQNAQRGVTVNLADEEATDGDGGTDTLTNIENVRGSDYDDTLTGNGLRNELVGGNGDDTLEGGPGDDRLEGGTGDDYLVSGEGNDTLEGGAGVDLARYWNAGAGVTVNLANEEATDDGDGGTDTLTGIEAVVGSDYDDRLTGNDEDNFLEGGDGNDSLEGGEGYDYLVGGAGDDTLEGGAGVDLAGYWNAGAGVTVNLNTGVAMDGDGGTDTLISIERVRGSRYDDTLTGDDNSNVLAGGAGNDTLTGGAGVDTFLVDVSLVGVDTIVDFAVSEDSIDLDVADGEFKFLFLDGNVEFQIVNSDGASLVPHFGMYADMDAARGALMALDDDSLADQTFYVGVFEDIAGGDNWNYHVLKIVNDSTQAIAAGEIERYVTIHFESDLPTDYASVDVFLV